MNWTFVETLRADNVSAYYRLKTFKPQVAAVWNESLVNELKEGSADMEQKPEIIRGEQRVEVSYDLVHYFF